MVLIITVQSLENFPYGGLVVPRLNESSSSTSTTITIDFSTVGDHFFTLSTGVESVTIAAAGINSSMSENKEQLLLKHLHLKLDYILELMVIGILRMEVHHHYQVIMKCMMYLIIMLLMH